MSEQEQKARRVLDGDHPVRTTWSDVAVDAHRRALAAGVLMQNPNTADKHLVTRTLSAIAGLLGALAMRITEWESAELVVGEEVGDPGVGPGDQLVELNKIWRALRLGPDVGFSVDQTLKVIERLVADSVKVGLREGDHVTVYETQNNLYQSSRTGTVQRDSATANGFMVVIEK